MTDRPAEAATRENGEILPCPFCGKPPETQPSGEGGRGLMIDCITKNCVNPHVSYYSHAAAKAVWNRRALSTHQQQGVDAWVETISVKEALKRADELRTRAVACREELLAGGAHPGYAEEAPSISIIHSGNPYFSRAPQPDTVTEAFRAALSAKGK